MPSSQLDPKTESRENRNTRRTFLTVVLMLLVFVGGSKLFAANVTAEHEADQRWLAARRAEPPQLVSGSTTLRFVQHTNGKSGARVEVIAWVEGKWRTPNCSGIAGTRSYLDKQAVLRLGKKTYYEREASLTYNKRTLHNDRLWVDLWGLQASPDTLALFRCEPAPAK